VETLPFVEIDKVAVFDDKICLWRRGQDEPAARISPDSKNASVLAALMSEWIEHQRECSSGPPEATPGASGMGRLLFERRLNDPFITIVRYVLHFGLMGTIVLLVGHHVAPLCVVLLAEFLLHWLYGRHSFRCYELGLVRRRGRSEFRLLYDEITEFTFSATPSYYRGAYIGTQLNLTSRAPRGTIRYAARVQNLDADLEYLRDHICKVIADRMLGDLQDGHTVPWTSDVVFLPQGLQFRRSKMFGLASGPVEILPYEQIRSANISEGVFLLYSEAEAKPVLSKPIGAANFFPGFFAVLALQELAQNIPSSSRASSVIISGDQGGVSVTSTFTSPAPSSAVKTSRTSANNWGP
jgi:hypothetical protein